MSEVAMDKYSECFAPTFESDQTSSTGLSSPFLEGSKKATPATILVHCQETFHLDHSSVIASTAKRSPHKPTAIKSLTICNHFFTVILSIFCEGSCIYFTSLASMAQLTLKQLPVGAKHSK
jgi:hypothetical protein